MTWQAIESQAELDELNESACWDDSQVIEYLAARGPKPYYPSDISRSGYSHLDLRLLIEVCLTSRPFLELTFIECEHLGSNAPERLHLSGRVDTLKRVEIRSADEPPLLRAARLIYRWLEAAPIDGTYYSAAAAPEHRAVEWRE